MLVFSVFQLPEVSGTGRAGGDWSIRQAYLLGPDDVPVQADVRLADGLLRCEKRSGEAAAVCVQVGVEPTEQSPGGKGAGLLMLQTCLLPERDRPYLLSVELARHRLMVVLNKLEDWALFDLPSEDPVMAMFEEAREAFTEAVVAAGGANRGGQSHNGVTGAAAYSVEADRLGRRALALAVEAGEALALKQAVAQHSKRMTGELATAAAKIATPPSALTDHEAAASRAALIGSVGVILPTPPQVGCAINAEQFTPQLQKMVSTSCDFIGMPMRWVDMEPTEGKYAFAKTDRWIEWAVRQAKLPIVGGPVIDFRKASVPEWLYIWEHDYETLRELVYEHVKTIVTRYRRTVGTWTIASGLHVNSNFTFSFEQVMDLTRMCVMVVRKLQPSAKVMIEIDQPWGEYYAENPRSIPPVMYAEIVSQAGINADLFGIRVQMGQAEPGRMTRDMMSLSALLDRYAALEKPISVSAFAGPSEVSETARRAAGGLDSGYWRTPWSPEAQVQWMTAVAAVATSKPYVHSVCWQDLYDLARPGDTHRDGLISAGGQPKPSMARLAEIRQALKDKRSPAALVGDMSAGAPAAVTTSAG